MSAGTTIELAPDADLGAIINAYSAVADRLKASHELLTREVGRLHEQLAEKDRLLQRRERLAALGEMAAGVAHEIRNPLGGIGLYASLLERDLTDRPTQRDLANRISAGVRSLDAIVSDILAFARSPEPSWHSVVLGQVLTRVVDHATPQATALEATLTVDDTLLDEALQADALQLERTFTNLVFNALDAAGAGGHVEIARATPPRPDWLAVAVRDDGPGVPSELMARVFDPFFTTKDTGTGLGLAIVHRIIEAHGGQITLANRVPAGAEFVLALPRSAASEADASGQGVE